MPAGHRSAAQAGRAPSGSSRRSRRSNTHSSLTPARVEQLERPLVAGADVLGPVRVARERHRRAGLDAHLAGTPAPGRSRRRGLRSPAVETSTAIPDSAMPRSRARSSGAGRPRARGRSPPPHLHEVGVGEDVEQAAARGLAERLEVAPPDLLGAARAAPRRCSRPCRRASSREEVHRADHVVEVAAPRAGSAMRSSRAGHEVDLEPEPQVGLRRARRRSRRRCRRARARARTGGARSSSACVEAVDVLGDPELGDARARSPPSR